MILKFLGFILTLIICSVRAEIKIPDYITICKRNDPKLAECWMKNYNEIMPRAAESGIPEFNVGPFDPFVMDSMSLDVGTGSVSFKSDLQDLKLWGMKDAKAIAASVNLKKGIFKSSINVPSVHMQSKYKTKGKVLLFQFDSTGEFTLNLTNANLNMTYAFAPYERDGKEFMRGNVTHIDITMDSSKIYLENLFPNKDLNAAANDAFNANVDIIYPEMKPLILKSVANVVTGILNNVYDGSIPFDVFYP